LIRVETVAEPFSWAASSWAIKTSERDEVDGHADGTAETRTLVGTLVKTEATVRFAGANSPSAIKRSGTETRAHSRALNAPRRRVCRVRPAEEPSERLRSQWASSRATTGRGTMTTETELVSSKIQERVTQSGLLAADETVIAYVNGYGLPPTPSTSPLRTAFAAITMPYRPSYWRAVILTDRQLYICSMGTRPGTLKSVLAKYPLGAFTASIKEGSRSVVWFSVEDELISCPASGRMRRCADMIVAAGKTREVVG
jgi:hypothetical protein